VYFQAGINIVSIVTTGATTVVRYGSVTNKVYVLEYATNVADLSWRPAAGPQFGTDYFQELQDTEATNQHRLYRITSEPVIP
jgi:hypothetical protein